MKRIEQLVLKVFRVPENEHESILSQLQESVNQPQTESTRGLVAWSVLTVYAESPPLIFCALFGIFIVVPYVILMNLIY